MWRPSHQREIASPFGPPLRRGTMGRSRARYQAQVLQDQSIRQSPLDRRPTERRGRGHGPVPARESTLLPCSHLTGSGQGKPRRAFLQSGGALGPPT
eukprot:1746579-Pyramimonas_sp.AAC.1